MQNKVSNGSKKEMLAVLGTMTRAEREIENLYHPIYLRYNKADQNLVHSAL